MADRAFDCHTQARPKGRGDAREGDGVMDDDGWLWWLDINFPTLGPGPIFEGYITVSFVWDFVTVQT